MKKITFLLICFFFSIWVLAQDTFSIVAVDTITGEVGSAGASCIHGSLIISDVHPGVGAIHTQSYWKTENQQYAKQLMDDGLSPQQIIDSLIANDVQNNPKIRQYGIVDLSGDSARTAAFTGENCFDYKNHILGPNYAIQGNILLGQEILDSMEARYLSTDGDLSCKLMAALQGAKVVGADTRCAPYGISSASAFVRLAQPDDDEDSLYLHLNVHSANSGVDPIDSLQVLFDDWGGCWMTGISPDPAKQSVHVYPNPAIEKVTFKFNTRTLNSKTDIVIFNSLGQAVHQISGISSNEIKWNIGTTAEGIYYYKVLSDGALTFTGKIIVK